MSATIDAAPAEIAAVERMIGEARARASIDRGTAELVLGAPLDDAGDDARWQVFAGRARRGGVEFDAELRLPVPGGGAAAGPLLVVRMAGGCADRAALMARLGPLALAGVPRGRSLDEEAAWSREEAWGTLVLGFAERRPDCLASLVFRGRAA